jgi:Xaa-Pro aminopeptidase
MSANNIQACIIPSTDPHLSEYTPAHWETRQWISGFTGSAGTVVVTSIKAGLWTDSRYFLQAENELQDTGIELFKLGLEETVALEKWIVNELSVNDTVGLDGKVFAASEALYLIAFFEKHQLRIQSDFTPYDTIWENRPPIPRNKTFILPEHFSGESANSKMQRLLKEMSKQKCNFTILAALDMIAWLFNLRGNDVNYNPVAVSYAVVSEKETILFIDFQKLTPEVVEYLHEQGVILAEYDKMDAHVQKLSSNDRLLITPNKINYHLYQIIPANCKIQEINVHPVDALKAIKNETEIRGFRNAMQKDGVALIKFFYWLEKQLKAGKKITEIDVSQQLKAFRSEQEYFFSESFNTIVGYGAHGAIPHYSANEETNVRILPEGILLIDSGAQYFDGTTDITRTIAVGAVSDEMKKDFTLVLKGHIQLAATVFPKGTIGMQLDVLARQFLWKESQNYLHGTGHGIGHFLNVHEGPQGIRANYNPVAFQPGMITSNEPGLYKTGKYGIRIENLLLTIPHKTTDLGEFYALETLTLCPIDKKLIDWSLMTQDETNWLKSYHQKMYDSLSPFLNEEEKDWLKEQL